MQIEGIKIINHKLIQSYKGDINGKHVYLIGGNRKGKTSFIDAVFTGLTGKDMPPEPLTIGENKGVIEIDLGEFIARTKFKKNRPAEFEIENKFYTDESDKFMKAPRTYLEKRIGLLDFNIVKFLALTDMKQVEYVAKNFDIDFGDIETQIEELTEGRRADKRDLTSLKSKVDYYNRADAEKELVDIVAVSKEIEAETAKTSAYNKVKEGVNKRELRIKSINEQIAALELERDGDGEGVKGLFLEVADGDEWLNNPAHALMSDEDLATKIQTRDNSTATNKKIQDAKNAKKVDEDIVEIEQQIEDYNEAIEFQKRLKGTRISEVLSIDELTYDTAQEKFLFDGLPFDKNQTNTATQLIIGMKIAAMMLKELKIARIDASLIDKVEFDKVLAWADENGIELFIELVDREATQLKIVVDG